MLDSLPLSDLKTLISESSWVSTSWKNDCIFYLVSCFCFIRFTQVHLLKLSTIERKYWKPWYDGVKKGAHILQWMRSKVKADFIVLFGKEKSFCLARSHRVQRLIFQNFIVGKTWCKSCILEGDIWSILQCHICWILKMKLKISEEIEGSDVCLIMEVRLKLNVGNTFTMCAWLCLCEPWEQTYHLVIWLKNWSQKIRGKQRRRTDHMISCLLLGRWLFRIKDENTECWK